MVDNSLTITPKLGIGFGFERTNPILQLRELEKQIENPPMTSVGDRATLMRLLAQRREIQSGSTLFSTLKSELVELNSLAQEASGSKRNRPTV